MDNNEIPDASRREFLLKVGVGAALLTTGSIGLPACSTAQSVDHIQGEMVGANHRIGHKLRVVTELYKLPVNEQLTTDVLIIGGGVAGLSARRWLQRQGVQDVLLLEMETKTGGNAAYGQNAVSAYPFGAHYLPIPDLRNVDLLQFLQQSGAIKEYDSAGLPVYNEYFLCHDPEERLYINGFWQEGLVPDVGVPEDDRAQIRRFLQLVAHYKTTKGMDGRDAFAIPLDNSSRDQLFRELDVISFSTFLDREKFTSPYLRWYLTYCCRDEYGATLETTSAWAGVHYFASRKGKAANAQDTSVLTWPQGNGFLADQLRKQATTPIRPTMLAYQISDETDYAVVRALDTTTDRTILIRAKKVIVATPQFITKQLLRTLAPDRVTTDSFRYAPWMVANLTVSGLPQGRGMPLCWDNVLYSMPSVGYISANHQDLQNSSQRVLTFYKPLTEEPPDAARQSAFDTSYKQWLTQILDELETAHAGVTAQVSQAEICVWGHGMIAPSPGFIWGADRQRAAKPINNRVFFAHSDLSGISIFEEAFYQGIRAANEVIDTL
jgi:hypothetical protein